MRLVLLGPPGAGKGTQAAKLTECFGIVQISTGDIFRWNIKNETELGVKVKEFLAEGKLVPDELTIDLVWDRLDKDDCGEGYLLDGFPRTIKQAEALSDGLKERDQELNAVINFNVPEEVLIRRLAGRRVCPECGASYHVDTHPPKVAGVCDRCGTALIQRDDDKESVVRGRLEVYRSSTAPLIDYYRERGLLVDVDGTKPVDEVTEDIRKAID